jgi:putative salt-induced outer membrane protein YdiY
MKRLFVSLFFAILTINLLHLNPLKADELTFKNGDRISGKILNMNEKQVVIKTSYAGEITANWTEIVNAKTDQKIAFILKNGIEYLGNIIEAGKGLIKLNSSGKNKTPSVAIEEIEMIKTSEEEEIKIKTRANAGMSYTRGNTNKDNSYFDGEFSARTTSNRYTAGGRLNRSDTNGVRSENNAIGFLKYDRFLSKRLFMYGNAQYEKDRLKDLNLRSVYGIGTGYQFLEMPLENLYVEAGINYVTEDYFTIQDEDYASGRWAVNYDKFLYNKVFQLFHFHEGFGSFERADDMFIKSKTGVRIPIFTNLNASLQYNFDWDNTPSPGRKKTDRALMFTLGYFFAN